MYHNVGVDGGFKEIWSTWQLVREVSYLFELICVRGQIPRRQSQWPLRFGPVSPATPGVTLTTPRVSNIVLPPAVSALHFF
jgi:hypothetical protein